jgi:hypothetical protein
MSKTEKFKFDHPNDITIGVGRIVYANEQEVKGVKLPEGWALPGGIRTTNRDHAEHAARQINDAARRMGG